MKRMKTFFMMFVAVVVIYFGSNYLINISLNNTYKDITSYNNVKENGIVFEIKEAKATSVNGYIKGVIKNNSSSMLEEKYLKVEFYSKRDVCLETKYLKIENLSKGSNFDIDYKFKIDNVSYVIISIADNEFINNIA